MRINRKMLMLAILSLVISPVYAQKEKAKEKVKKLPPGLQKKVDAGKPLPPGWEKKLVVGEILEPNIYTRGQIVTPLDTNGVVTLKIEGKLVRLYQATREIIEILK